MALNLEKQLLFYGQYHHDPVNVGIHIACVPLILLTAFQMGTNSPALNTPDLLQEAYLPLNLGTCAAFLYSILYILMEPVAGGMLFPLLMAATAYANFATQTYGNIATYVAIGIHLVSWVAQFIGHGKFEGRAPALLDNLIQAIFLAPLFVWLEVLFHFGYRPELKSRLDRNIAIEIKKFKDNKGSIEHTHATRSKSANGKAK